MIELGAKYCSCFPPMETVFGRTSILGCVVSLKEQFDILGIRSFTFLPRVRQEDEFHFHISTLNMNLEASSSSDLVYSFKHN